MMTAEQLKGSILQLAMQGKLVEQRADEGTGEDLYKKIIGERQKLVKKGIIKKEKDSSDKNEEAPFDIPDSWKWAKLNDIVAKTIKRGKSPKYTPKSNTLVFAQKCNTKAGPIDLSLCLFLDENQLSKYPEEEFMINEDIVINSTGNGTLGRVGIYKDSDNPEGKLLVPDSHVTVIRCNALMDVGYVFYCLKYYQPYMEKLGSGSTNQTELGAGIIKDLFFPLPPLVEQKRIVAKIEELMPFVEQYATASTKLNTLNTNFPEMMKKSILQEAVQGKLVPQDPNDEPASVLLKKIAEEKKKLIKEGKIKKQKSLPEITENEIPFDIPESWEWVRLGNIVSILGDGIHGTPKYDDFGEFFFVNGNNLSNGKIEIKANTKRVNKSEYEKYKKALDDSSILVSINGTIGNIAFYNNEPVMLGKSACYFNLIERKLKPYVFWLIKTDYFMKYAFAKATGTTIKNVSLQAMNNFLVPLPSIDEQERIVGRVEELIPYAEGLMRQ